MTVVTAVTVVIVVTAVTVVTVVTAVTVVIVVTAVTVVIGPGMMSPIYTCSMHCTLCTIPETATV